MFAYLQAIKHNSVVGMSNFGSYFELAQHTKCISDITEERSVLRLARSLITYSRVRYCLFALRFIHANRHFHYVTTERLWANTGFVK